MQSQHSSIARRIALVVPVAAFVAACAGGAGRMPTPGADLMAGTTVGKYRCEVGKENDRPFVVEWDSTDLANFESKTARDIVFVKIDGCNLKVLDCRDDGIAGQYGAYDAPQWTSGTVEGFDIKNEGELYAKLPLGAVSLSAAVEAGNDLHLKYFVSGTRPSLRNTVYRADIQKNPLCASATHFVSGYDLGAFEVSQSAHDKASAGVSSGAIGGGGSLAHNEAHLKNAGKLDDCTGDTAKELSRCKVPIRLSLRAITDGENPNPPQTTAVTKPPEGIQPGMTPQEQAMALGQSAMKKMQLKDGPGCILDLDRMAKLDPKGEARGNYTMVRASCEMLSGKCDQGKKRYRTWLEAVSPGLTPEQLDQSVSHQAATQCGKNQGTPAERANRAQMAIYPARQKKNVAACLEQGNSLMTALKEWKTTDEDEARTRKGYLMNVKYAADCLADNGGDCAAATKMMTFYTTELYDKQQTRDAVFKSFKCPSEKKN